jgi:hypothetical protein
LVVVAVVDVVEVAVEWESQGVEDLEPVAVG